jgi:hypothetical protein
METPGTSGFDAEERDQEDTGADSAADASRLDETEVDQDTDVAPEGVVPGDEDLEDRGDV